MLTDSAQKKDSKYLGGSQKLLKAVLKILPIPNKFLHCSVEIYILTSMNPINQTSDSRNRSEGFEVCDVTINVYPKGESFIKTIKTNSYSI
jgi:hypothetical protein